MPLGSVSPADDLDLDHSDSVHHSQPSQTTLPHPVCQGINVHPTGQADAARAGVAAVDAERAASGVEARLKIKPEIVALRFGLTQGIVTGG